ncbi:MAG: cytochrome c biogenesis protein CcdA [Candidatus Kapaibacteriota bacterium]
MNITSIRVNISLTLSFFVTILLACFPAQAFQSGLKEHAKISLDKQQFVVKAGDTVMVRVSMDIESGWHAYDHLQNGRNAKSGSGIGPSPTTIKSLKNTVFSVGRLQAPKSDISYDSTFEVQIGTWHGRIAITVPLIIKKTLKKGIYVDSLEVESQVCTDEGICTYPKKRYAILINVNQEATDITAADTAAIAAVDSTAVAPTEQAKTPAPKKSEAKVSEGKVSESQQEYNNAKNEGVFSFLWAAILAGFAALTTPCVYPMIPITVSFFTKRSEKPSARSVVDSMVFATGIIATFTILGLLFALLSNAAGIRNFANDPLMNLFLATIFIVFAFNLFGAFEIMLPPSLLNKLNSASSKGNSFGSVLLMGITFSITSFTCTLGFVAAAFGEAASAVKGGEGDLFYPMLGMLGFSTAFALPFFLLALFPSRLNKLPKAGTWMNNVKVVLGFLELALALSYLSRTDATWELGLFSRELILAFWVGCSILSMLYILGLFRMKLDSPVQNLSAMRVVWALMFATVSFYLLQGIFGRPVGEFEAFIYSDSSAPAATASIGGGVKSEEEEWTEDYQAALKLAKEKNQPIFIDFTGVTCTNCRKMEKNVFPRPQISELMGKMIKVRLYTDRNRPEDKANERMMQEQYQSAELPLYVILTPDGKAIDQTGYTPDTEKFQNFLKKALQ